MTMSNSITTYRAEMAAEAATAEQARLEAAATLSELEKFVVSDQAGSDLAADVIREVKDTWRDLEERRKAAVKPLNDEVKTVNGWFKPALEALELVERRLKDEVARYLRQKAEEARANLARAAVAESREEAATALAAVEQVAVPEGVSVRRVWKYRVVDEMAVSRGLCSPDPKKIEAFMKAQLAAGGISAVPGLEFYQEDVVAVRR